MAPREIDLSTAPGRPSPDVAEWLTRARSGQREAHYAALLGLRRYDSIYLVDQIQRGLSYSAFARFQRNTGLPNQVLSALVEIPERTLARRKETGRLQPDESDRLARAARVFARALELFEGDVDAARAWLLSPRPALGGRKPLEFARSDVGAIEVDNLIGRLEHGIPT
jgi:putative toxin-antitoxin system antitoxin component (TIGR02293 family)